MIRRVLALGAAFLLGSITGPVLGAPTVITLQPGESITIQAATPTPTPTPAVPTPSTTPSTTASAVPTPTANPYSFDEECDSLNPAWHYDGAWGAGFGSQSDFMGDLRNVSVAGGICTLTARKMTTPSGRAWGAALMSTRGTFSQAYGTYILRAKLPSGMGLWPAWWMDPADGTWPPEIDLGEWYPNTAGVWPGPTRWYTTLHYGSNQTHELITVGPDLTAAFHVYQVDWRPGSITARLDGTVVGTISADVPSGPEFLILDLAVGNWSAQSNGTTPSPSLFQVDYIRVTP